MKFKGSGRLQIVTLLGDDHVLNAFYLEKHRHVQMTSNGSLGKVLKFCSDAFLRIIIWGEGISIKGVT